MLPMRGIGEGLTEGGESRPAAELQAAAAMAGRLCSARTEGGRGEAGREDKDRDGTNAMEG